MRYLKDGIFAGIINLINKFKDTVKAGTDFVNSISGVFDGVKNILNGFANGLNAKALLKIAAAIGILALSLVIISGIDSGKIMTSLGAMAGLIAEMIATLTILAKTLDVKTTRGLLKLATSMTVMSVGVLILASAIKNISDLNWDQVTRGLVAIGVICGEIVLTAKALAKNEGSILKGAGNLLFFASGIKILADVLSDLSVLDWEAIKRGLGALGGILLEIIAVTKFADFSKLGVSAGLGMIGVATGVLILGKAIENMSKLGWEEIARGLLTLAGSLMFISIAIQELPSGMVGKGFAMIELGTALLIISKAVQNMGSMDWTSIARGLTVLAGSLIAITTAINFMPSGMISKALGLIGIGAALLIIGQAIKNMGSMDLATIGKGLLTLSLGLLAICAATIAMNGALVGAAALLIVASALVPLALALKMLSGIEHPIKALLELAGAFIVIGAASVALTALSPALLVASAALLAFGVATGVAGAGILLLSAAMTALSIAGVAGTTALVTMITSVISLIPMMLEQLGLGIIAMASVIGNSAPQLIEAFVKVLMAMIDSAEQVIPRVIEVTGKLIVGFLQALANWTPDIIQAGFDILIGFLRGIADNIGEVVATAIDIMINFVKGIVSKIPDLVDAAYDCVIGFIDGLADGIEKNTPRLVESIIHLGKAVIKGLLDGLKAGIKSIWEGAKEIAKSLLDGFKSFLGIHSPSTVFADMGKYIIEGIINGLKNGLKSIGESIKEVGENIVNGFKSFFHISSPSRVMRDQVGKWIVEGIAEGITKNMSAEEAAKKKAQNIANAFKEEFSKIDLTTTTSNLEFKLWDTLDNGKSGDITYYKKAMDNTATELENANKKVELAKGKWEINIEQFGQESKEAREAYNEYLQQQITAAELSNKMGEYQDILTESTERAKKEYYDYITKNSKLLKELGYTNEQIAKEASAVSGYTPDYMIKNMEVDVKEATLSAMETVSQVYESKAEETFGALTPKFYEHGQDYGENTAEGIESKVPENKNATNTLTEACLKILQAVAPQWYSAGKVAAQQFAKAVNDVAASQQQHAIQENSPQPTHSPKPRLSEVYSTGQDSGTAYANGFDDGVSHGEWIGNGVTGSQKRKQQSESNMKTIVDVAAKAAETISNMNPVLKVGLDISKVLTGTDSLSGVINRVSSGISNKTSSRSAKKASSSYDYLTPKSSSSSNSSSNSDKPLLNKVTNFVQNITSPKAVSTTEVYRQTKTLISSIKV